MWRAGEQVVQPGEGPGHQLDARLRILVAQQPKQTDLIHVPQLPHLVGPAGRIERLGGDRRARLVEPRAEEEAFRQWRLAAGLTQVVDRRQQQLRQFLAMAFDVLQVTAQHVQGVAQRGQLPVTLLAGAGRDVRGLLQDLLGQQFGTGQLDQAEGAAHLVQAFHRLLQGGAVVSLGDELLEILLSLFHGGEQLVAHQTQGRCSRNHAYCASRAGLTNCYGCPERLSRQIPASACS
ncbi:hypothetical protein D9M70_369010 [compost metagenome]